MYSSHHEIPVKTSLSSVSPGCVLRMAEGMRRSEFVQFLDCYDLVISSFFSFVSSDVIYYYYYYLTLYYQLTPCFTLND